MHSTSNFYVIDARDHRIYDPTGEGLQALLEENALSEHTFVALGAIGSICCYAGAFFRGPLAVLFSSIGGCQLLESCMGIAYSQSVNSSRVEAYIAERGFVDLTHVEGVELEERHYIVIFYQG